MEELNSFSKEQQAQYFLGKKKLKKDVTDVVLNSPIGKFSSIFET